jgi:CubicO group peptidase (beta-lactamase class C family)
MSKAREGIQVPPCTARELGIRRGFPPPTDKRVTHANWDSPPFNRWAFQHIREILPTAEVRRGSGHAARFETDLQDLDDLAVTDQDRRQMTLRQVLDQTYTDGFLVLRRGRLVLERYFNGLGEDTLHLSQSVAKSVTAAAAGVLVGRGLLDPEAPVSDYVPELGRSGYAGATLRHLLDMRSGVRFSEDYGVPGADVMHEEYVCGWKPWPADAPADLPSCMYDFMLTLPKERDHGGPFLYRSIETDVIAWAMERVSDTPLPELVSREIWQPLGAERDANFTVDPAGFASADGGFNASLRDYGRFGQMYCNGGAFNDGQILPADFVCDTLAGDPTAFAGPYKDIFPRGAYRNQFWIRDVDKTQIMARGVFGQLIYIDASNEIVVVKLSSWPHYLNLEFLLTTLAAIDAITEALCG